MGSKASSFPDMNWFEFEVMSQLLLEDMYGNQILQVLEEKFGSEVVYSGKLYPTLQRLEKKDFIHRKEAATKGETSRGIDPIYYSLTPKGRREIETTTMHTVVAFFDGAMKNLRINVAIRAMDIVMDSGEPPFRTGFALLGSERQVGPDVINLIRSIEELEPVLIYVEDLCENCGLCKGGLPEAGGMMTVRARADDLPLKDEYLDVLITVVLYRGGESWTTFMKEALRTVKPGGRVIMVEFGHFNSYILEEIMNNIHKLSGAVCDLEELDEETLTEPLEGLLTDIGSERVKEMILVHGRKA
jgi:DNA-binding PadR family transcriptional regulator